jgi:hypothetical protein
MSGCTVQRLEAPGLTYLKVSGTIDETFSATQLAQQIRADTILHLGKVTRFSSFGVREWVRLMKDLKGRVKNCLLVECSPAVVNQLNMVVDFAAGAHVKSIQLPYVCQDDELDQLHVVDVDAQREALLAGRLPQVPCPRCKKPMIFDDLPGSYLAFLREAAAPEAGSAMAAFIKSFEQAAPKLDAGADAARPTGALASSPPTPAAGTPAAGAATGASGGSSAMRWGVAAAAVALLAAGGYAVMNMRTPPPPPPPPPSDPVVEKPAPPPRRSITPEEGVEFNTLITSERFPEAEGWVAAREQVLTEDSQKTLKGLVQRSRADAMERHLQRATELSRKGKHQEGREELELAIAAGGESDRVLSQQIAQERKAGNCPAVIASAEAMAARYPTSTYSKSAADAKRACLALQRIQPAEMRRAMAAIQAELDGCLTARGEGATNPIELAWTVAPSGMPNQIKCTTPSLATSPLCQCLTEQVRRLRFSEKNGTQVRLASHVFGATN